MHLSRFSYYFLATLPLLAALFVFFQPVWAVTSAFTQTILPGSASVGFTDEAGNGSNEAVVDLNADTVQSNSQVITAVLGTPNQKVHIINPALDTKWAVTLAAKNGPSATWDNDNGVDSYDYNNAVGQQGQMTVDPSGANIIAIPDNRTCPVGGLFLGSASSFRAGADPITDITIVSGSALYSTYCAWDLTGIKIQQVVPAEQPLGTYHLPFTLTIL